MKVTFFEWNCGNENSFPFYSDFFPTGLSFSLDWLKRLVSEVGDAGVRVERVRAISKRK